MYNNLKQHRDIDLILKAMNWHLYKNAFYTLFFILVSAIDRKFSIFKIKTTTSNNKEFKSIYMLVFYFLHTIEHLQNQKPKTKNNQAQSECNLNVIFINSLQSVPVHFSEMEINANARINQTTKQHNATEFC